MSALLQGKEEIDEFYAERFKEEEGDEGFNPESGILSYLISSSGDWTTTTEDEDEVDADFDEPEVESEEESEEDSQQKPKRKVH